MAGALTGNGKADAVGRWMGEAMVVGTVAVLLAAGGCKRQSKPAAPVPPPATAPHASPASAPATRAAATQALQARAEPSVMEINGKPWFFPPARLRVEEKEGVVRAQLYSSSQPTIPEKSDAGNLYYFDIPLDIDDPAQIEHAQWSIESTSQQQDDSPNGIFLDGMKMQLQPYNVHILFNRDGQNIMVRVVGQFLQFSDEQPAPQVVKVDAALTAAVQQP
jgi:hypothetical protein